MLIIPKFKRRFAIWFDNIFDEQLKSPSLINYRIDSPWMNRFNSGWRCEKLAVRIRLCLCLIGCAWTIISILTPVLNFRQPFTFYVVILKRDDEMSWKQWTAKKTRDLIPKYLISLVVTHKPKFIAFRCDSFYRVENAEVNATFGRRFWVERTFGRSDMSSK